MNYEPSAGSSRFYLPKHLDLLDEHLVALTTGALKKDGYRGLVVAMPPRHGKSELCSHYLPPWYLGRWPERKVALASYEADFARTWGRKARESLEECGKEWFGVRVDHKQSAASDWNVLPAIGRPRESGYGGMMTTGIGGPLTGRGADLLIIDDPVKNAVEAHSLTKRNSNWDWFTSTAMTRLEPGAVVLMIGTRWHEDDLIGRLLASEEGQRFLVLHLPAIADRDTDPLGRERGAALWPERFPEEELERTRRSLGSYVWASLYQGRPTEREGGMFQTDWLRVVPERPARTVRAVRAWDTAATEAEGDYTVGIRMESLSNGQTIITDVVRGQWSEKAVEDNIIATARRDGRNVRVRFAQERGSAGKMTVDRYRRLLSGFHVRGKQETGDKELRARALSACAERGDLRLLAGSWNDELIEEYVQFPHGQFDDQVDAGSLAYEVVSRRTGVQVI